MTLYTNIENYSVSLYNSKLKTSFSTQCLQTVCELIDLAPFQYEMTLSKEGYKNYTQNITITPWEDLVIKAVLEKQLLIKKIETPEMPEEENTKNQIEKVRDLSFLQKTYKYFSLSELGDFYFQENSDNSLTLFRKNQSQTLNLYSFEKIKSVFLDIKPVFQTNDMIAIFHAEDAYIYDLSDNTIEKVYFPQKIDYVKKSGNFYHFVNEKGTFLYDTRSKKMEYFYLFKDFIPYEDDFYLGIIFASETEKKKNYNLEHTSHNLIIKYNFKTKQIKVLETTSTNVTKITLEDNAVYFYDNGENKYQVKNID